MTENLLRNWAFCDGSHLQDGIPQIGVPDDWRLDWLDGVPFPGIGAGLTACRPESVVVDIYSVSPADQQELFHLNGESTRYAWKIFKGMAPMYAACSQEVHGLTVGKRYRFTMWTYADIVESYEGGKHFSSDLWAAEVRAGVSCIAADWDSYIWWGDWHNETNGLLTFGEYRPIVVEFEAAEPDVRVWFEMKAKWGLPNNGWWLWGASLYELSEEPPAPPVVGRIEVELGPETVALFERLFRGGG